MSYLRSVRFPEEVRAPMQEEADRRGVSVNKMIVQVMRDLGESSGSTEQAQALTADEKPKPATTRKRRASSDGGSNPPSPTKKASKTQKSDSIVECRHGIPDCRICQTGRWAG